MRHSARLLILAVFSVANAFGQSAVDKPSLVVGDRWTLRSVDVRKNEELTKYEIRVTAVAGDEVALERAILSSTVARNVGQKSTLKVDAATLTVANSRMVEGKFIAFAFPLEIGKTWDFDYTIRLADADNVAWQRKAKVEGWEEVVVPAGKFKALKVVHDCRWIRSETGARYTGVATETIWYSPEAKRWVLREWLSRRAIGAIDDHVKDELVALELQK